MEDVIAITNPNNISSLISDEIKSAEQTSLFIFRIIREDESEERTLLRIIPDSLNELKHNILNHSVCYDTLDSALAVISHVATVLVPFHQRDVAFVPSTEEGKWHFYAH